MAVVKDAAMMVPTKVRADMEEVDNKKVVMAEMTILMVSKEVCDRVLLLHIFIGSIAGLSMDVGRLWKRKT